VIKAGEAGIYVDVMLFDGWALHLSPAPDHIEGNPFHALNNINGISAQSINDLQVLPLDPRIEAIQEAYITKVVDLARLRRRDVYRGSPPDGAWRVAVTLVR
jgi:hypothetical protein